VTSTSDANPDINTSKFVEANDEKGLIDLVKNVQSDCNGKPS